MECFGPDWDTDKLVGHLGESFKILECGMKGFPTEALTHTHITATLKAVIENDIHPEEIEKVDVTTIARACDILFDAHKYEPKSRETADHSLPYCIARAILDRKITTQSFTPEKINDPKLPDMIRKIKGLASVEFEQMFPAKQPSRVTIKLKNGASHSVYLEYPKGDPREPMSAADLENKFEALSSELLTREQQQIIKDAVFSAERFTTRSFMKLLAQK